MPLALLLVCCLALAGQVRTAMDPPGDPVSKLEDRCSIEGIVLNAVTGKPLKKANITAYQIGGNAGGSVVSDAAGHFKIEGIDPGRYNLLTDRSGFLTQMYGAKGPNRLGTPLMLTPGQDLKDIVFKLTPHGAITGRVQDQDGDPLPNVLLQCQRYRYYQGKKELVPAGTEKTNDLGEYRIFGLTPSKYYVSAQYPFFNFSPNGANARKDYEEGYAPLYYPNSFTPDAAAGIEVTAGTQIRSIDLTLTKTRAIRIRGQVISGVTNAAVRNANVELVPRDNSSMWMQDRAIARGLDPKGNFELHNVLPGSYFVVAQIFEDNRRTMAKVPIDTGTSNIDGVPLFMNSAPDLNGRVIVENDADTKGALFYVGLASRDPGPYGSGSAQAKEDGTFTIKSVMPDVYTVSVNGFSDDFYMKAVRFGDNDVTDTEVDFTQGVTPGELTVIISAAGGQVDGTVQNAKSEPAAGARVVLIPAPEKRSINRLYKTASTDQNGNFSLKGIAPGEYKLFAWEQVEYSAYQDPDFLKPFDSKGESVTIKENSHENKQLSLIPEAAPPQSR